MKPKVAIITQDIRDFGGVSTHVKFVYGFLEKTGFEPCILHYATRRYDNFLNKTLINPLHEIKIREDAVNGMHTIIIGCYFPEFEFMHYFANHLWKKVTENFDAFIVVTGPAVFGFPLAQLGKKYTCWVGTTALDDRRDRIKRFSLLRKILAYLVLPFVRLQEKKTLVKAYKVMSTTDYTKRCLIGEFGVKKDIPVVHIPLNTNLFHPTKHKSNKKGYILFVGRANDPRKNINLLIQAFRTISDPSLKLVIAGEQPSKGLVRACGEGFGKRIIFKKRISQRELIGLYQNASLFVLPSLQEGCGLALLEAMACGLPVISTRCGGPEDIIQNNENGILVKNNDSRALADAMIYLLNKPQICKKMGENARRFVEKNYSVNKVEKRLKNILKGAYPGLFQK